MRNYGWTALAVLGVLGQAIEAHGGGAQHGCLENQAGALAYYTVDLWPTRELAVKCTKDESKSPPEICEDKATSALPAGEPTDVSDPPNSATIEIHGAGGVVVYVPRSAFNRDEKKCERLRRDRVAAFDALVPEFESQRHPETRESVANRCRRTCLEIGGMATDAGSECDRCNVLCEGSAECIRSSSKYSEEYDDVADAPPVHGLEKMSCTSGQWRWQPAGKGYTPLYMPGHCQTENDIRRRQAKAERARVADFIRRHRAP